MKGLKKVSDESKKKNVRLYYSIEKDTVYTEDGAGRHYLTTLIRYNTPDEVKKTVEQFMRY